MRLRGAGRCGEQALEPAIAYGAQDRDRFLVTVDGLFERVLLVIQASQVAAEVPLVEPRSALAEFVERGLVLLARVNKIAGFLFEYAQVSADHRHYGGVGQGRVDRQRLIVVLASFAKAPLLQAQGSDVFVQREHQHRRFRRSCVRQPVLVRAERFFQPALAVMQKPVAAAHAGVCGVIVDFGEQRERMLVVPARRREFAARELDLARLGQDLGMQQRRQIAAGEGVVDVALRLRQFAEQAQRARAHQMGLGLVDAGCSDRRRSQRSVESLDIPAEQTAALDHRFERETQGQDGACRSFEVLFGVHQRGRDILVLQREKGQRFMSALAGSRFGEFGRKIGEIGGMCGSHPCGGTELFELFAGVGCDASVVEKAQLALAFGHAALEQRFLAQRLQQVERATDTDTRHGDERRRREAVTKHTARRQRLSLVGSEQFPRPIECFSQRGLTGRGITRPSAEDVELVDSSLELVDAQHAEPCRSKLDREWNAIEHCEHSRDGVRIFGSQLEVWRALDQQADCFGLRRGTLCCLGVPLERERSDFVDLLGGDPKRLARGDEHQCIRRDRSKRSHRVGRFGDQLFDVVEHEQRAAARRHHQPQKLERIAVFRKPQPEHQGRPLVKLGGGARRIQVHEPRAPGQGSAIPQLPGEPQRQACLTGARRTHERHQPPGLAFQQLFELDELPRPPHEGSQLAWQI